MAIAAGRLNRRVRIERPVPDDSLDGAGSGSWAPVAETWAEVQDVLPSRGEASVALGTTMTRPARVRMRYRTDITGDMRIVSGEREMHIISGPVEMRFREGLEMMVAEYMPGSPRP